MIARRLLWIVSTALCLLSCTDSSKIYDFKAESNSGQQVNFADYKGKVLLIVNTASKCGFTPQYDGLEALYQKYQDKGLVIIGFPCDQFGHQEPGSDSEIEEFCRLNYGVTFPLMAKSEVNGENANEIFKWLYSRNHLPVLETVIPASIWTDCLLVSILTMPQSLTSNGILPSSCLTGRGEWWPDSSLS